MNSNRQQLLLDIDDTILTFTGPFQDWVRTKGYSFDRCMRQMSLDNGECGIQGLLGVSREKADELVEEFTLHTDSFANLPPEPCALAVLPKLHEAGFQMIAITASFDNEYNRKRRAENLYRAFGFNFDHVHCTGLHNSKELMLRAYEPTIWVEDNFNNAVLGSEIGHISYLLDRSYTRGLEHKDVKRVKNWHEIADVLLKEQK